MPGIEPPPHLVVRYADQWASEATAYLIYQNLRFIIETGLLARCWAYYLLSQFGLLVYLVTLIGVGVVNRGAGLLLLPHDFI